MGANKLVVLMAFLGWGGIVYYCFRAGEIRKGEKLFSTSVARSAASPESKDETMSVVSDQLKKLAAKVGSQPTSPVASLDDVMERMALMQKFPTEVLSDASELPVRDQERWLLRVRCQGMAGNPLMQFLAIFQMAGEPGGTVAQGLRKGMRLQLELEPVESHLDEIQQQVVADGEGDLSLPQFWVKAYHHQESLLTRRENVMRDLGSQMTSYFAFRAPVELAPADGGARPLYLWSGWDLYWPDAEDRLMQRGSGKPLDSVLGFNKLLRSEGTELVFALIPQAASLYADLAVGRHDGPVMKDVSHQAAVRNFIARLEKEGVHVVNLHDYLGNRRFVNFEGGDHPVVATVDSHWSSVGTALAAEEISRVVRSLPGQELFPKTVGVDLEVKRFVAMSESTLDQAANPLKLRAQFKSAPMLFSAVTASTPEGQQLLEPDCPDAPVHLIGDSNSNIYADHHSGVHAHLVRSLGTNVHVTAMSGGSANASPLAWMREHGGKGHAKVVVWLVAERFLTESVWANFSGMKSPLTGAINPIGTTKR